MSTFSEQLAAAKAAARPTKDVQVILDPGLSQKRAELLAEVEAAKAKAENDPRLTAVDEEELKVQEKLDALLEASANSLRTIRFAQLPGDKWGDITSRCPVRLDAPIDRSYGYNMQQASMMAAPLCGVAVEEDGTEVPLIVSDATADSPAVDEWADLFERITGHEFIRIMDAIYELNEWAPGERINTLKKQLANRPA